MKLPARKAVLNLRQTSTAFNQGADQPPLAQVSFEEAYDLLLKQITTICKVHPDTNKPEAEEKVREAFSKFLLSQNLLFAHKNFEALLKEKSGHKKYRDDGSVGWYHEFVPILSFLSGVRLGYEKGGVDLSAVNKYGGLDVAISTHLRHDSFEDHSTLYKNRRAFTASLKKILRQIKAENPNYDMDLGAEKVVLTVNNVILMSQRKIKPPEALLIPNSNKKIDDESVDHLIEYLDYVCGKDNPVSAAFRVSRESGQYKDQKDALFTFFQLDNDKRQEIIKMMSKEHVKIYTSRMLEDPRASPFVFLFKQFDNSHNFGTLLGAKKFKEPKKRLKRCDEREDMHGPRFDLIRRAIERWPDHERLFKVADSIMGFNIYPHFRYLENVDLYYKSPSLNPLSGLARFAKDALLLNVPPKFSLVHIGLVGMINSVDPKIDPKKYQRLALFVKHVIKPPLEEFSKHFPYLFNGGHRHPIARPNGGMPLGQVLPG